MIHTRVFIHVVACNAYNLYQRKHSNNKGYTSKFNNRTVHANLITPGMFPTQGGHRPPKEHTICFRLACIRISSSGLASASPLDFWPVSNMRTEPASTRPVHCSSSFNALWACANVAKGSAREPFPCDNRCSSFAYGSPSLRICTRFLWPSAVTLQPPSRITSSPSGSHLHKGAVEPGVRVHMPHNHVYIYTYNLYTRTYYILVSKAAIGIHSYTRRDKMYTQAHERTHA
jgi:hypothetical protein